MKVLMVHNHYQQPGGEDLSFEQEGRLLESHGHQVIRYTRHNDEITEMGRIEMARRTIWNPQTYRQLRELIRSERPSVALFTNTFPIISPSAYYAAKRERVAIVQSLRNYRLLCPSAQFMRDGRVCEDCLNRILPWPGVVHACYRNSVLASATVASMLTFHRLRRTWTRAVDQYFALTEVSREKFVQGGLPANKVAVKPNFIDPPPEAGYGDGGFAIFAGRLAPEKGIEVLLEAWRQLDYPLKIVGDGPLASVVSNAAAAHPAIEWLGHRTAAETIDWIGKATCLIVPSLWYEGFPRTIVESYAKGTPVIASRLGSMQEIVHDRQTGLHFEPGNAEQLAERVHWFLDNPAFIASARAAARDEFTQKFTGAVNYQQLMEIIQRAIDHSNGGHKEVS